MKYKLFIAALPFMFLTSHDLLHFLDAMFTNSTAKDKLYGSIIEWNTEILYRSCFTECMTEEQQIKVFNALVLLEESYSKFYDPQRILFYSQNKLQ